VAAQRLFLPTCCCTERADGLQKGCGETRKTKVLHQLRGAALHPQPLALACLGPRRTALIGPLPTFIFSLSLLVLSEPSFKVSSSWSFPYLHSKSLLVGPLSGTARPSYLHYLCSNNSRSTVCARTRPGLLPLLHTTPFHSHLLLRFDLHSTALQPPACLLRRLRPLLLLLLLQPPVLQPLCQLD